MRNVTCAYCDRPMVFMCDFATVFPPRKGVPTRTCDRPMCQYHRVLRGSYIACTRGGLGRNTSERGTVDYCPHHGGRVFGNARPRVCPVCYRFGTGRSMIGNGGDVTQNGVSVWLGQYPMRRLGRPGNRQNRRFRRRILNGSGNGGGRRGRGASRRNGRNARRSWQRPPSMTRCPPAGPARATGRPAGTR
jgi:hypothetical protein